MDHGEKLQKVCRSLLELPGETSFSSLVFVLAAGGVHGENAPNAVFKSIKSVFWDIKRSLKSLELKEVSTVVSPSKVKGFTVPVSSGVLLVSSRVREDSKLSDASLLAGKDRCIELAAHCLDAHPHSVFRMVSVLSTHWAFELSGLGKDSITSNHRFSCLNFLPKNVAFRFMDETNGDGSVPIQKTDVFLYD